MMTKKRDNAKPALASRALACLLSAAMVVAFTPVVAWGGEGETTSTPGTLTVTVSSDTGSYTSEGGIVTITSSGSFAIGCSGTTTTDSIVVNPGVTADITLSGVNIQSSGCAFKVSDGATVNLTLVGANTLKSGGSNAGLYVGANQLTGEELVQGTLSIVASDDASLEVTGGSGAAGIGGGSGEAAGRITISGGKVTAIGGDGGSGISGDVCIAGGVIEATGGSGGAGIDGTFSTGEKVDAVVFASSIAESSFQSRASWSGVVCEGVGYEQSSLTITHEVPGPKVTICEDLTLDSGARMTIGSNATVAIGQGAALTNAGVIGINAVETNEDGTVAVAQSGKLTNDGYIFSFGTIEGVITGNGPVVKASAPSATASQLVYNGEAQELVTGGSITSGSTELAQLQYRCVENGKEAQTEDVIWSQGIPSATEAGTYTVYYRLVSGDITSSEFSLRVTIDKATPTITIEPESVTARPGEGVELRISSSGLPEGATYQFLYEGSLFNPDVTDNGNGVFALNVPSGKGQFILWAYYPMEDNYIVGRCTITVVNSASINVLPAPSPIKESETTVDVPEGQTLKVFLQDPLKALKVDEDTLGINVANFKEGSDRYNDLMLDFSGLGTEIEHVTFASSSLKNISDVANDPGNSMSSMRLTMSNGSVSLDKDALAAIASQITGEEATISIEEKSLAILTAPQQSALKSFLAVGACYELSVNSGGEEVHDLGSGTANILLSNEGEPTYNAYLSFETFKIEDLEPVLVYVDDDGNTEYEDSTVLEVDGKQYLATWKNHFSVYAIVYVQPTEATKAARAALGALPVAGELTLEDAQAAVAQARELLEQVAALPDDQRAVVSSGLVANAEQVVEHGTALIEEAAAKKARADEKAASKVKSKSFSVKAGSKKVIYFKTTSSSAGTRVTFKKASGSKYISVTKAGKVTAKKGMRPGKKYTARVKVTCGATTRYVKITVRAR